MSTPDQINAPAPAGEGHQAPPPIQEPGRQAQQGQGEVPSPQPDHDKKPETADDEAVATPKTAEPS